MASIAIAHPFIEGHCLVLPACSVEFHFRSAYDMIIAQLLRHPWWGVTESLNNEASTTRMLEACCKLSLVGDVAEAFEFGGCELQLWTLSVRERAERDG